MTFADGTIKVQVRGALPGGEIFSWGFSCVASSGAASVQCTQVCAIVEETLTSAITPELFQLIPAGAAYTSVAAYHYAGGPHADAQDMIALGRAGTGVANPLPNQVAIVVTHETARPGRSYRGRSYVPALRLNLGADGQIPDSILNAVLADFQTLATNLEENDEDGGPIHLVVASSKGFNTPVTALSADTRPDIQRRRAESQAINDRVMHALT